jgi:hypothetical protein
MEYGEERWSQSGEERWRGEVERRAERRGRVE